MRDITDGASNTIAMAERSRPNDLLDKGMVAVAAGSDPATFIPFECAITFRGGRYLPGIPMLIHSTSPGYRWGDGAAFFQAITTILPPNSASCLIGDATWPSGGGHFAPGIWTASSEHAGGVMVLLADGSVRFVSNQIDAGDASGQTPSAATGGASSYGPWGALGTKDSGESINGEW
jgi:prepilin-type processing-associated H-X9-DG protein